MKTAVKETEKRKGGFLSRDVDVLNAPVVSSSIKYTIPLILTNMLSSLYNAADVAVVGNLADTAAVASVGATSAIIGLLVGLFQVVAILPGLSRSGSTITGGLIQGFYRSLAVKFSFILSIPAIVGAAVFEMPDFFASIPDTKILLTYLAGALAAMLVGIAAIKLITWISKHSTFRIFAYYCFAVGVLAIVWDILA